MSKTVTATLPAVLLVIFWWQRGRIEWKRDVLPLAPWFAVAVPAGLFTAWVERTPRLIGAQGAEYALTVPQHLLLAGRVPWFYAWKLLWPFDLMFIYPRWKIDPDQPWQYIFPLAIGGAGGRPRSSGAQKTRTPRRSSHFRGHAFSRARLLERLSVSLLLRCRSFPVPGRPGHHRSGRCRAGGLSPGGFRQGRIVAIALPALLLIPLGFATWRQSGDLSGLRNAVPRDARAKPDSAFLHNNLGVILMSSGREPDAVPEFEAAVRLKPDNADYRVNLGLALSQMPGRMNDAIAEYRTALRLDPHFPAAHLNLGLAYTSMPGRLPDAISEYQKAIEEYQTAVRGEPELWQAHFNLGLAYAQIAGRETDAIAEYRTAVR